MRIVINNTNIVIPDKELVLKNSSLVIDNGVISRIDEGVRYRYDYGANVVIDAEEGYLIPGLINHHSHGFTLGPLFPSGGVPLTFEFIFRDLNRHLLQGTTTLLNLDGFATIEEVEIINKLHPIKIKTATSHTPLNIKAAEIADGAGLTQLHKNLTVEEMLDRGAIAIGEVGAGSTLGGGAAIYLILPRAIEEKIGKRITPAQSGKLIKAVLGRHIDPSLTDKEKVQDALEEAGLKDLLTADDAIDLVMKTIYAPVEIARDGIREAADLALKYDVSLIVHNATASKDAVLEAAKRLGPKLVAGHSNHPSFEKEEMIQVMKELRKYGAIIDVWCGDYFGARQLFSTDSIDATLKVLEEGLGDVLSTDFAGGNWDPILRIIEKAVEEKVISLPKAIAMVSYNVVKAIPKLAPNCGTIAVGKTADLTILDVNKLSKVKYVFIDGVPVVINGQIKVPKPMLDLGS
ncbi:MAG: amidohydrolase family protein [Dehalococcoidia bacterium]|nr:amidohydrolase family protein [Dehalococcoidia bacterium]